MSPLHILSAAFLATIQDLGRPGYERYGVPEGGAMDRFALMAANALVGNPLGATGLEFALAGPSLWSDEDTLVALAGRGYTLRIDGRPVPAWMAAWVRRGEIIDIVGVGKSCRSLTGLDDCEPMLSDAQTRPYQGQPEIYPPGWGYLAVAGGVMAPEVLGSRSAWLKGGLGGLSGLLQAGDVLPVGDLNAHSLTTSSSAALYSRAGLSLPASKRPAYSPNPTVDVVPGMQADQFRNSNSPIRDLQSEICNPKSEIANSPFFHNEYTLTPACDRMGYRLSGPPVTLSGTPDILSEGIPLGAVQVPGDGQPIVLLADRQTTGGYPKLGAVTSASLPLLVQAPVGGRVRFRAVSVEGAQRDWRILIAGLEKLI